ncbi:MAG: NAD-dependent epimerase/dehydratase family protein [Cyanobacteria bacterium]|jgi:nucleoside-diphosphate-sugar epimerase|nr:NAD-dependent epimerase/dehydratase family protein [Cyanobacteria bacterium GSL.Bin21]
MGKYIVTGAGGFIGSHLVEALLAQEKTVLGIDEFNDYYDPNQKRRNLEKVLNHPQFTLLESNILDLDWVTLLADVEVIFHQAAQAGVRASWGTTFYLYTERNLNATQVMLEAAKNAPQLTRFVYASSSSVYGNAERLPTPESTCPQPVSPYGITKLAAEQLCWQYHQNFEVPATALRYFTVYGPRQRPDMAFHKFLKAVLNEEPISIYGDGLQTRDFTFISDAIAANLAAATAPEAVGKAFNVGGGSRVSLSEVLEKMAVVTGRKIARNYFPQATGDARDTSADISQAQQLLGYNPQVDLRTGLTREWEWIQQYYL